MAAGSCVEAFFLESSCNDLKLLEKNIMLKLLGPDYKSRDKDASLADFRQRVRNYEKQYAAMGPDHNEQEFPYLQLIDLERRVVANCINGFLSAQTVEYLLKLRLHERQIWITRNGKRYHWKELGAESKRSKIRFSIDRVSQRTA
jgi:6-phosphofructo-2-kinase